MDLQGLSSFVVYQLCAVVVGYQLKVVFGTLSDPWYQKVLPACLERCCAVHKCLDPARSALSFWQQCASKLAAFAREICNNCQLVAKTGGCLNYSEHSSDSLSLNHREAESARRVPARRCQYTRDIFYVHIILPSLATPATLE